ncbi:MAG: hypothetical protein ACI4JK_03335 [Oscillospiraceae bacterium]
MKKDRIRDYATAAFRDYAKDTSLKPMTTSQRDDFIAVDKTLKHFMSTGKPYIVYAVKAVYCAGINEQLRLHDISSRVRRFAIEHHADESTVYRWLKEARCKFAEYRGLTL